MSDNLLRLGFRLPTLLLLAAALPGTARPADYSATVLQDNPLGYWRLAEAAGPSVTNLGSLGPAANGQVSGNVAFGQPGAIAADSNPAAGFDGAAAKVEIPYLDALNGTAFTYEVWANVMPDSSGVHRSPLASRDDTPSGNTAGVIFYADPGDNWQFWNGRGSESWNIVGGATVIPGVWSHLVGTFDGTNKAFYVDGVLVGADRTAFQPNAARPLRIGASANENPVGQFFFNGSIDEVAIYSGVLPGDRILAHYKAGAGADPLATPPFLVADPQAAAVFKGDSPTLSVLVTGSLPLSYQWQREGVDIAGATNYFLTFTNAQPSSSGVYRAVVRNAAGEIVSADAALDVSEIAKPQITEQPRSRTVLPGANVTLRVVASGSATFEYQWQFKGANLANATNATLTLTNVQSSVTGAYQVVVSNPAGTVTSAEALVQLPAAATLSYADTVKQDGPVSYWRLDEKSGDTAADSIDGNSGVYLNGVTLGTPGALVGDTNTSVGFSAASQQKIDVPFSPNLNTTQFTVELWAKVTGGTSHRSPLTSRADAPQRGYIFYADPANTWQFWTGKGDTSGWDILGSPAVQNNVWAHLVGVYDGTNKFFYVNGSLVGSKTVAFAPNDESVLRIGAGASESDGSFFFEGAVDDVSFYDKPLSEDRILAHYVAGFPLTTPPAITSQPASKFVPVGATVTFTVAATGGLPLGYQWNFNGSALPGATNASLTVTNVQAANAGAYTVTVRNSGGSATSDAANLQLPPEPTLGYPETVEADHPVGYWRLDERAGETAFDTVGQNHGTYLNGVALGLPGALLGRGDIALTNTAAGFESTNLTKVDVPFSEALNPPAFSVELWAKVTGGDGTYRSPVTSRGDAPQRGYIIYAVPANSWQFWTGGGDAGGWDTLAGPPVVSNQWTHLVGTFDGTTKRFYVNGIEVASSTPPFGPNTENPLRIGAGKSETEGDYFFQGNVDEVSVYDKALTPVQVVTHYVAGQPPQTGGSDLGIQRSGNQVILTWTGGVLQEAASILGPWQNVNNATSPYPVTPAGTQKFYRRN